MNRRNGVNYRNDIMNDPGLFLKKFIEKKREECILVEKCRSIKRCKNESSCNNYLRKRRFVRPVWLPLLFVQSFGQ